MDVSHRSRPVYVAGVAGMALAIGSSCRNQDCWGEMRIHLTKRGQSTFAHRLANLASKDSFEGCSLKDGDCGPQLSEGTGNRGEVYVGHGNLESSSTMLEKAGQQGACCKHLYISTLILGNKQEKLEFSAQSRIADISEITEMWRDSSHDCKASVGGCRMVRRDTQGR